MKNNSSARAFRVMKNIAGKFSIGSSLTSGEGRSGAGTSGFCRVREAECLLRSQPRGDLSRHSFSATAEALRGHQTGQLTPAQTARSEEHTSELQSLRHLVCR